MIIWLQLNISLQIEIKKELLNMLINYKTKRRIDLFLICYDVQKDQSKGTNYHKVMEYLAYGKPIISNNISSYSQSNNLINMCQSRDSNLKLLKIAQEEINDLDLKNNKSQREYSKANSYGTQIAKILKTLN